MSADPVNVTNGNVQLQKAEVMTKMTILTKGLIYPRGLKFRPDGNLYVTEAGTGSTPGCSTQSTPDLQPHIFSPYYGCTTGGRISQIDPSSGIRKTVVDNLPTSVGTRNGKKADVFGPADVAFIGNTIYK